MPRAGRGFAASGHQRCGSKCPGTWTNCGATQRGVARRGLACLETALCSHEDPGPPDPLRGKGLINRLLHKIAPIAYTVDQNENLRPVYRS